MEQTAPPTDLRAAAPAPQHAMAASAAAPAPTADPKLRDPCLCVATTQVGQPCTRRGKEVHPEHGFLCGVHLRSASRHVECCICLSQVKSRQRKELQCGHAFHKRCIKKWFGRGSLTCPMCRTVCLGELGSSHSLLSARIRHLLHVVPPPPNICFAAYMLGLLNSEPVLRALGVGLEQQQLLVELAYQSFTQHHFFEYMRQLHM